MKVVEENLKDKISFGDNHYRVSARNAFVIEINETFLFIY